MEASSPPDREAARSCIGCAHRMAAHGLGGPFIARHDPAYQLFTSGSNNPLAAVDVLGRNRRRSRCRTGRVVLIVRSSRRRYYPVGCLGRLCVHRICSRDAQRSSTSAGVLIRASGASSIIASDQLDPTDPDRANSIGSQNCRSCSISFQMRSQHSFKSS
jgi:hypothetical protein